VKGDLVLVYEQDHEKLGLESWNMYDMAHNYLCITKGSYLLVDYKEKSFFETQNGFYLKKHYA